MSEFKSTLFPSTSIATPPFYWTEERDASAILPSWQWHYTGISAAVLLDGLKIFTKYFKHLDYFYLATIILME